MKRLYVILLVVALIISCLTGCNSSKSREIFDKAKSTVSNYTGLKLSFSLATTSGSSSVESYKLYCDAIAEECQGTSHYNGLVIIGENRTFNEYYVQGPTVYSRSNSGIATYDAEEKSTGYSLKSDFIALLSALSSLSWKESENKTQVVLTHKLSSSDIESLFNSTKLGNVLTDFTGSGISKLDLVNCSISAKFTKETNVPISLAIDLTKAVPDIAKQEGIDSVILTVVISEVNSIPAKIKIKDTVIPETTEPDDGATKENAKEAPGETQEVSENRDDPATPVRGEPVYEGVPHYPDGYKPEGSGEEIIYDSEYTKPSEVPTVEITEEPSKETTEPAAMPSEDGSYRRHSPDKVSGNEFTINGKYYNGLSITMGQLLQNGWVVLDVVSDEGNIVYPGKTHFLEFAPENNNGLSYATIDLEYVNDTDSEVEVSPKYLSSIYVNVKDPGYDIMLLDTYFTGPKGFVNGMTYSELVEILGNGKVSSSSEGVIECSWVLGDLNLTVYVSNTIGVYAFKLSR